MAMKILFVLILSSILYSSTVDSANRNISSFYYDDDKTECKVESDLLDGENFRHLMETKTEVDLVKFRMAWLGQELSYNSSDYLDPNTWVWASHSSGEGMLSLPFDADILSLGTLTKDVFSMDANLIFTPEVCNQILTDEEKTMLVAQAIHENVTSGYDNAKLCHLKLVVATKVTNVARLEYKCCELGTLNTTFDCDLTVRKHVGIAYSLAFIEALSFITVLFVPYLITYLSLSRHDDQSEFGTEQRLMYINVEVPVGIGKLWRMIYCKLPSRFKRIMLFFVILPGISITWNLVYFFLKNHELDLRISHDIVTPELTSPFLTTVFAPSPSKIAFVCIWSACILFTAIFICLPANTDHIYQLIARSTSCKCPTCAVMNICINIPSSPPSPLVQTSNIDSFHSFLSVHLKILTADTFWEGLKQFVSKPFIWSENSIVRCVSYLVFIIPMFIVLFLIFFVLTPACMSFFFLLMVAHAYLIERNINASGGKVVSLAIVPASGCAGYAILVFFTGTIQLMRLFGFTIMGILVHADFYVPFVIYGLSILFYFRNYWHQLYLRYFHFKMSLIQECEKQSETPGQVQLIFYNKTKIPAIPRELFHIVCRELMPIGVNIAVTLLKFVLILIFLSFVLTSMISFGKFRDFNALTKTLASLAMSSLPKLLSMVGSSNSQDLNNAISQRKLAHVVSEYAAGRMTYDSDSQPGHGDVIQHNHAEGVTNAGAMAPPQPPTVRRPCNVIRAKVK